MRLEKSVSAVTIAGSLLTGTTPSATATTVLINIHVLLFAGSVRAAAEKVSRFVPFEEIAADQELGRECPLEEWWLVL